MLTVVIADDDVRVCNGMKMILEQNCPDIQISASFDNGKDLLSYVENNHIDILITDISMPQLDGLETCKYISEHRLDIHVIAVTGHHLFNYAKRAIDYGVDHFLIKPFSSTELINYVNQISKKICEKQNDAIRSTAYYINNWNMLNHFILDIEAGRMSYNVISNKLFCSFTTPADRLKCCEIRFKHSLPTGAGDMLEFDSPSMSSFWTGSAAIIFYYLDEAIEQHICDFEKCFFIKFDTKPEYTLEFFSDIMDWCEQCESRVITTRFLSLLYDNRRTEAKAYIKNKLITISGNIIKNIYRCIYHSLDEKSLIQGGFPNIENTDLDVLKQFISNIPDLIANHVSSNILVARAKSFIDQSYSDCNLSLSAISDELNITYSYLGKLFKSKTGVNLIDYLTAVRMENAKKLLLESNMSVKAISHAVGYIKTEYFRQKFKNHTGITPIQFKRLVEVEENNGVQNK